MPELPEVETIKRELEPYVVGRTITGVTLNWEGIAKKTTPEEFRSRVVGQKIVGLERYGKYLSFKLGSGDILAIHLKMSGSLLLNAGSPDNRFVRAVIDLDEGYKIQFRDPRKFGAMWVVDDIKRVVGKLGPDPLKPDFTAETLGGILRDRSAPIKALLCDQHLIAGIGNMYADEALFASGIHPMRPGRSLTPDEIVRLHGAIREVLLQGLGDKGASVLNYYRPGGETGTAHFAFKVAHRRKAKCLVCGTDIERIPVRNRGSYFCPKCQR